MTRKTSLYPLFCCAVMFIALWQQSAAQSPTITSFAPSRGTVGSLVTIKGTNLVNDSTHISIGGTQALAVSATDTQFVVMVMPYTKSGGVSVSTTGGIATGSNAFTVITRIPPEAQQGPKITPADTAGVAPITGFGLSLASSADGNTVIAGAKDAARILVRSNGVWTQQARLVVGTGQTNNTSYAAVAINADGNTAVIGNVADSNGTGAVWVFTRNNGVWAQQGPKLLGIDGIGAFVTTLPGQGCSVSISADGNTLVEGTALGDSGAAWVFVRSNGVWKQRGYKLTANFLPDPNFHNGPQIWALDGSVAISADGSTVILSAIGKEISQQLITSSNGAFVFVQGSNGWWQQQGYQLEGFGGIGYPAFSGTLAISADGNTAVLGKGVDSGGVLVYVRHNGVWLQQQTGFLGTGGIPPGHTVESSQGFCVALSADGNTIVEGGPHDTSNHILDNGAVWVFTRDSTILQPQAVWHQHSSKLVGTGGIGSPLHGLRTVISADGSTAIESGYGDKSGTGAFWVFTDSASAPPATYPPFSFENFTATKKGDSILLAWKTDNENSILLKEYQLQRHSNETGFTILETIVPNGAAGQNSYTFLDTIPFKRDNNFYRILALSKSTFSQYSDTLVVNIPEAAAAPTITSFAPSHGVVGSLVTITGTNLVNDSAHVYIGGTPAIIVSSIDTQLVVMVMPNTVSGEISLSTTGGMAADSNIFTITVRTPPDAQQGPKITPLDANITQENFFGRALTISADGNTAIASGQVDGATVLVRSNGLWMQQASLVIPNQSVNGVAMSANGNTAFIAAGGIWVFTRNNGVWTHQGLQLVGGTGHSPSVSADGNTLVTGGSAAALVFTRHNGVWAQQPSKLTDATNSSIFFGSSVAISADGGTVIVSANDKNTLNGAFIFVHDNNGVWQQQGRELTVQEDIDNTTGAASNISVAISADGNTAAVGDGKDDGAVTVFVRNNGVWQQQGTNHLIGTGANPGGDKGGSMQGSSVALSADGNTLVEGGPDDSSNNIINKGAIWVFTRNNNTWQQHGKKLVGTGGIATSVTSSFQGSSVAISADGTTAIEGGPGDDIDNGAFWVFTDSAAVALPVTIKNFAAYKLGKGVETAWAGYDEVNMAGYNVQRSSDGKQFVTIGYVPANGNTQDNYTWFDAAPLDGDNYYRIKAISKDGQGQYSNIVKVSMATGLGNIQVYPNPTNGKTIQVQLNGMPAGTYALTVYNAVGQVVSQQPIVYAGGNTTQTVNLNNMATGIYQVEVKGTNSRYTVKVAVQ